MNFIAWVKRKLPTAHTLARLPGFGRLSVWLAARPALWQPTRRRIALGVALGVGVGVIPLPTQMVLAALAAGCFRANVAAAVAATWLTNPLTAAPIWALAAWLGGTVLDIAAPARAAGTAGLATPASLDELWAWAQGLSAQILVGLPLAALVLGAGSYAVVSGLWRLEVRRRRRAPWRTRAATPDKPDPLDLGPACQTAGKTSRSAPCAQASVHFEGSRHDCPC